MHSVSVGATLDELRARKETAKRSFVHFNILDAEVTTNYGEGHDKYDNVTSIRIADRASTMMLVKLEELDPCADTEGEFLAVSAVEIAFRGAAEYETLAASLEFLAGAIRSQGVRVRS